MFAAIIDGFVGAMLAYSAIAKFANMDEFQASLTRVRLIGNRPRHIATSIVVAESLIALGLLTGAAAPLPRIAAAFLFTLFTGRKRDLTTSVNAAAMIGARMSRAAGMAVLASALAQALVL